MPCMAAEALAMVLITHGTCRMTWARQGNFLALLALMRCVGKRVTAKTDWVWDASYHVSIYNRCCRSKVNDCREGVLYNGLGTVRDVFWFVSIRFNNVYCRVFTVGAKGWVEKLRRHGRAEQGTRCANYRRIFADESWCPVDRRK